MVSIVNANFKRLQKTSMVQCFERVICNGACMLKHEIRTFRILFCSESIICIVTNIFFGGKFQTSWISS